MNRKFHRAPDGDAPAGTGTIDFEKLTGPDQGATGDLQVDLNNLPDMTSQMKAEMTKNQPPATPNPPAPPAPGANVPDVLEWMKPYEGFNAKLKEKFTDFSLPQDITAEKYNDYVLEFVEKKNQAKKIDPMLERFQQEIESGKHIDDVIENYASTNNFLKLDPERRMFVHMKQQFGKSDQNPTGLDDAAIEDRVTKMKNSGQLEMIDAQITKEYKTSLEAQKTAIEQQRIADYQKEFETVENDRQKYVEKSIEDFKKFDNIAGLPITQSEKEEFADIFRFINKRDPNTGLSIAEALLQSDTVFTKAIYMILKAEPKIRQSITEAKEGTKKSFVDKLSTDPDLIKGNQSVANPLKVDLDALAAPERY